MSRVTKALADTATKLLFRSAEVTAVTELGPHFRSVELTGDDLQKASWSVGDKIQIRTEPDGFGTRTYTPVSWDTARGSTQLLAYVHGDGPGSAWVRSASVGTPCQFFGPRGSLKLDGSAGPILFVGDETSFALVSAWRGQNPAARPVAELFEVSDPDEARRVCDAVGLLSAQLFPRVEGAVHVEHLSAIVADALRMHADATLCLTGRAQTIAAIRRTLKDAGLARRPTHAKAYWDENRSGLD